ncbi:MAG: ISAzo13-like element transposase-related protein [Acidimicrobiales bacterium]
MEVDEEGLAGFFSVVMPLLDERQRRVVSGGVAQMLGRGGVAAVSRTASMSRSTVITGAREITAGAAEPRERVRKEGGGRKRLIDKDPNLLLELDDLVSPDTRGDPMSPLRWTSKSTYHLADTAITASHPATLSPVKRVANNGDQLLDPAPAPRRSSRRRR